MKLTTACMIAAAALLAAPAIATDEPAKAAETPKAESTKTAAKESKKEKHHYKTVTGEELAALIKDKKAIVVDSRSAEDYAKGHIDGAVNLPASDVTADSLKKVSEDKAAALVFYCGNVKCPASAKSAEKAHELGYTNIHKYPGGYEEWTEKKFM